MVTVNNTQHAMQYVNEQLIRINVQHIYINVNKNRHSFKNISRSHINISTRQHNTKNTTQKKLFVCTNLVYTKEGGGQGDMGRGGA